MKDVQDRIVQFSNRYKLTNVETGEVLGTFDFDEVTGTVEQVGTEIDAELFKNFAQIDGTYPSLMAGGVQCTQLYNNADLNDCVPENDKVFQAWVCTGHDISDTISNTPFANFGRTFYLTAVKTWYYAQDNSRFRVVQTLYSVASQGDSLIWTRSIDGAGTLGWSDWKEMVVADGSYPTLGAGYLSRTSIVSRGTSNSGWYACVTFSLNGQTGTSSKSTIFLVNGRYGDQGESTAARSGIIEVDIRLNNGTFTYAKLSYLAGNLENDDFCVAFDDTTNTVTLYVNLKVNYQGYHITELSAAVSAVDGETLATAAHSFYGTSAPANAVYAVVRNIASYAESIPAASQTVLGGAKMWVSNGKLYIKTT